MILIQSAGKQKAGRINRQERNAATKDMTGLFNASNYFTLTAKKKQEIPAPIH